MPHRTHTTQGTASGQRRIHRLVQLCAGIGLATLALGALAAAPTHASAEPWPEAGVTVVNNTGYGMTLQGSHAYQLTWDGTDQPEPYPLFDGQSRWLNMQAQDTCGAFPTIFACSLDDDDGGDLYFKSWYDQVPIDVHVATNEDGNLQADVESASGNHDRGDYPYYYKHKPQPAAGWDTWFSPAHLTVTLQPSDIGLG
jgi:hypothetical protein